MRRIFAIIILLCIVYFIGGYVAVYFGLITQDQYLAYAGIVGGLASVAGLFSFIKPAITKYDLHALELETLKSLVEKTGQVRSLEERRLQTKSEINDLETKKKEMELLVKKASMSLFLKEQYSQYEQKILTRLKSDDGLSESLSQITEIKRKLEVLEEEIETDPNVKTLREVIESANRRQNILEEVIETMPPFTRALYIVLRGFSRAVTSTIDTIK